MTKMTWYLPVLLGLVFPGSASPNPGDSTVAGWVAFSVQDFDYTETFDDGSIADTEAGLLPGVNLGLSIERNRVFAETALSAWSGNVGYHGPADTVTGEDLLDWNLLAGAEVYRHTATTVAVYAGAGYRYWERDIQSTATLSGLFETYEWWYGLLGLRLQRETGESVRLGADIRLLRPVQPEIQVEFASGFDDKDLDLGEETGVRVALTLEKKLDGKSSYFISPWFEYWELGRSRTGHLLQDGIVVGTVFEPMSETRNFGVNIGLVW
ncbi:MAG: hypothetical protein OEN52_04415 [Gammaproteobacteria bacterium]|nr:hypothetical protein [Gammaproteobacteria bacterium]